MSAPADTLFIFAAGRSGSTLLDLLLGAHADVASLGEITFLPRSFSRNAPCSCGATVRACPFWQRVAAEVRSSMGVDLHASPYALDLGFMGPANHVDARVQTAAYIHGWKLRNALFVARTRLDLALLDRLLGRLWRATEHNLQLFDIVRRLAPARVVVDSSKAYVKGLALYRRHPGRVRGIVLSRDGRGVLCSRMRAGVAREVGLRAWRSYYRRALPLIERVIAPEHRMQVRYEDLAADPLGTANHVFAWLGLPALADATALTTRIQHLPEGNDTRLRGLAQIRADETWRERLSAADLAYFEREGGALNRRLGHA